MIDTIRVLVPLTEGQWKKILSLVEYDDRWQFAIFNPKTGELYLRRVTGLVKQVHASWERDIRFDIPPTWQGEGKTSLTVELSLPKLWYGHNISLLYDFRAALGYLRDKLREAFKVRTLPQVDDWIVGRVDFCYAWGLPTPEAAKAMIESLKRLKYPYKQPQHRENSAFWPGKTYSVKIYNKLEEFRANDLRKLIKSKANPDWVDHLEQKASGVIRFEITGRHKFLRRLGITTVRDLLGYSCEYSINPEFLQWSEETAKLWNKQLTQTTGKLTHQIDSTYVIKMVLFIVASMGYIPLGEDKESFELKDGQLIEFPDIVSSEFGIEGDTTTIPGGQIRVSIKPKVMQILHDYLFKHVGDGNMSMLDQVKEKIFASYKGVTAGRLLATWTFIQRVGCQEAKEVLGHDGYYRDLRRLKKAGVTVIEATDNLIKVDSSFFSDFKLSIPSPHVVNRFDDFRDSDNLLNLKEYRDRKTS